MDCDKTSKSISLVYGIGYLKMSRILDQDAPRGHRLWTETFNKKAEPKGPSPSL